MLHISTWLWRFTHYFKLKSGVGVNFLINTTIIRFGYDLGHIMYAQLHTNDCVMTLGIYLINIHVHNYAMPSSLEFIFKKKYNIGIVLCDLAHSEMCRLNLNSASVPIPILSPLLFIQSLHSPLFKGLLV